MRPLVSPQVKEQRLVDAGAWLEELIAEAKTKLARTKEAASELKTYAARPCPAAMYVAMHDYFAGKAAELELNIEDAVTPVASLKRGARPVDVFSIRHDQIINDLLGPGVSFHHALTSGAIVKMVAPFDFYLKAKKDPITAELLKAKELVIKAHVVALVPNHATPQQPIFLMDQANFAYADGTELVYRRTLATAILGMSGVPPALRNWATAATQ